MSPDLSVYMKDVHADSSTRFTVYNVSIRELGEEFSTNESLSMLTNDAELTWIS